MEGCEGIVVKSGAGEEVPNGEVETCCWGGILAMLAGDTVTGGAETIELVWCRSSAIAWSV